MAFTEFYCDAASGSNLNSGSSTGAAVTYASGSWDAATGVFTVASGDPTTNVAVGDFASVYADGATVTGFVGRVTARDATTITVSLTAKSGTAPTNGTGNRTIKVGGPWKGPNGTEAFPFAWIASAMNDGTNLVPRVNMKSGTDYAVSSPGITNSSVGIWWQGYTTTIGDGGRAVIKGGAGAAYTLLLSSGNQNSYVDLIFDTNGDSGGTVSTQGVAVTGARSMFYRCVCRNMRRSGLYAASVVSWFVECEAYNCNIANGTGGGAIYIASSGCMMYRCYAHHNSGSNSHGFYADQSTLIFGCISHTNGGAGFYTQGDQMFSLINCDSYNNGSHGLWSTTTSATLQLSLQNCNFVKNGGWGFYVQNAIKYGVIANCGFGAGTQANALGQISATLYPVIITGTVTYPNDVTPWADPANGDFSIVLPQAKAAGRGAYTQIYGESGTTVGYPDIGAAQSKPGTRSY